jgi:hypothetical protein
LSSRIANIPTRFLLGEAPPSSAKALLLGFALVHIVGGASGLLRRPPRTRTRLPWVALSVGAAATLVPVLLALLGRDFLDARNLIAAWLPLVLALAAGYAAIGPRSGAAMAASLAALFLGLTIVDMADKTLWRTEYRGVARALGPAPGPGQRALVVSPDFSWTPLVYYLPRYPQLSSGNVGIREIDLIGWVTQTLPAGAVDALRRRGFHVVEERAVQRLRLVRLKATSVTSVSRSELVRSHLGVSSATVLIQTGA